MKNLKSQISRFKFLLVALVGIGLCSCKQEATSFLQSDLQGLWQENGTKHYIRFLAEQSTVKTEYCWGYEWDETDEETAVYEEDVKADQYGNGWFMYRLNKDELLEIHKMSGGDWADIPKTYIVTVLSSTTLTYYPKGYTNEKTSFTKQ